MKLIYKIALSLSGVMLVFVALWGIVFFNVMTAEINDETDDMLEDYSEDIIMKWLSGERLPSTDNGTNSTYYVRRVPEEYALANPWIRYEDSDIYIVSEKDDEPARIRRQIFMDSDGRYQELTVAVPTFERADLRRSILLSIIMLYVVLLLSVVAIAVAVVMLNLRPFKALMKWMDSYVPGKKNDPVPSGSDVVEFRKLAQAAQRAADRFERQYQLQSQFIGNASHELQTPLAVCSARIEMLLDSPDLTEAQAGELVKMQRSIRSLIKLNKTLLMMSRIENGQFVDTEDVDIGALLKENVEIYEEIHAPESKKADVEENGRCIWKMNPQLAGVLTGNLLKNAFNHSPAGTEVTVRYGSDGFSVSNPGDKPLDSSRVFTRFYQENPGKEGSTGLGLSLVRTICENSGLKVTYSFDGKRHVFTVTKAV
ncbi:MAG: HAMP domain-containing histidine kinase [Bacteroidetes bacterium]|uniref:histidine kinase n=1 Tax=Candidatus Cryptobacteroides intestinigallinarum TaxID=2840767 RepID=A0A9D9HL97_9BACT|nr:HAMP domain-containing histidine kinase [Candidatus Cryptobacteroides intestinigallinarum]